MLVGVALAALALRAGLAMRRRRLAGVRPDVGLRRRHLRLAKPAVVVIGVGFVAGPVSAVWLRGWEVFGTFHGWVGVGVVGLFGAAAWLGHRLEDGEISVREMHGRLGLAAVLFAALAAVAGFVLLP